MQRRRGKEVESRERGGVDPLREMRLLGGHHIHIPCVGALVGMIQQLWICGKQLDLNL